VRQPTTEDARRERTGHAGAGDPKKNWRQKSWRWWLGIALVGIVLLAVGVGGVVASAIMGRVCTDAKVPALQNFRERPFFAGLPRVLNVAHRGASTLALEHSLAAYELALQQGAHVLELDLRLLRDGELVVAHDRTLKRTLGSDAAFATLSLSELERIAGDLTPLTVAGVFGHFPHARFNLELKDEILAAPRALATLVLRRGIQDRVLVASSHRAVLAEFRRVTAGAVATSASAREALDYAFCYSMKRACPTDYSALQLPPLGWLGLTSSEFIRAAHDRGLAVHFWTVDEPERMRILIAAGADGIMTNRPDVLAGVLEGSP
jgi:glycerophosphoryl diester phosphodiesterase